PPAGVVVWDSPPATGAPSINPRAPSNPNALVSGCPPAQLDQRAPSHCCTVPTCALPATIGAMTLASSAFAPTSPILPGPVSVTHRFPSAPAAIALGPLFTVGLGNSEIAWVTGSISPILLTVVSV